MSRSGKTTIRVDYAPMRTAALAAALLLFAWPAKADLSSFALEVTATNASGAGTFQLNLNQLNYNAELDRWWWNSASPVSIMNQGNTAVVATINQISIAYVQDPQVSLGLFVEAGGSDTTFTITSALLSFPTLDPASGSVSAGITVTDNNGNGATLSGLHAGGAAYLAQYNGLVPGGTTFASLLTSPIMTTANGTTAATGEFPGGGAFSAIGVPVSSMSAQFSFMLSAGDSASSTSTFTVVPAPGAAIMIVGGLLAARGRRRR